MVKNDGYAAVNEERKAPAVHRLREFFHALVTGNFPVPECNGANAVSLR